MAVPEDADPDFQAGAASRETCSERPVQGINAPMTNPSGLRDLSREDWLTQLGPKFYDHPKAGQTDVSVFVGRLSLVQMLYIVGGPGRKRQRRDAVRYAQVGCLQDAGFTLVEDNELVNGGRHVRIQLHGEWTEEHSRRLRYCFSSEGSYEALGGER
jgi:hypothetical protein